MNKHANDIEVAEEEMPRISRRAARSAFRNVLKSGNSVLVARNGGIYRANPDGTYDFVKKTKPDIETQKGLIIKIK